MRPFTRLSDIVAAQKERNRKADRTRNPLTPQVARKAPKSVEKRP
jgi:hypothetical protein